MNPEVVPTDLPEIEKAEILEMEMPVDIESTDMANLEKAKKMAAEYNARYVYAGSIEKTSKRNVYNEKGDLIRLLYTVENPKTRSPYTENELQCVYLYHVIIGGSLSSDNRDGFPMNMQYDVEGDLIEKFILSIPEVPDSFTS